LIRSCMFFPSTLISLRLICDSPEHPSAFLPRTIDSALRGVLSSLARETSTSRSRIGLLVELRVRVRHRASTLRYTEEESTAYHQEDDGVGDELTDGVASPVHYDGERDRSNQRQERPEAYEAHHVACEPIHGLATRDVWDDRRSHSDYDGIVAVPDESPVDAGRFDADPVSPVGGWSDARERVIDGVVCQPICVRRYRLGSGIGLVPDDGDGIRSTPVDSDVHSERRMDVGRPIVGTDDDGEVEPSSEESSRACRAHLDGIGPTDERSSPECVVGSIVQPSTSRVVDGEVTEGLVPYSGPDVRSVPVARSVVSIVQCRRPVARWSRVCPYIERVVLPRILPVVFGLDGDGGIASLGSPSELVETSIPREPSRLVEDGVVGRDLVGSNAIAVAITRHPDESGVVDGASPIPFDVCACLSATPDGAIVERDVDGEMGQVV